VAIHNYSYESLTTIRKQGVSYCENSCNIIEKSFTAFRKFLLKMFVRSFANVSPIYLAVMFALASHNYSYESLTTIRKQGVSYCENSPNIIKKSFTALRKFVLKMFVRSFANVSPIYLAVMFALVIHNYSYECLTIIRKQGVSYCENCPNIVEKSFAAFRKFVLKMFVRSFANVSPIYLAVMFALARLMVAMQP
jgi:hypothetical protein